MRNSASIGSISGEWNAWLRPRAASRDIARPKLRRDRGHRVVDRRRPPPTRAVHRRDRDALGQQRQPPRPRRPAPPPSPHPRGSACINRARAATSAHASSSDSTPATCAAASSPIECPATKSGRTPHDSSSRNSATSTANSAGCVYPVSSSDRRRRRTSPRAAAVQLRVQVRAHLVERLGEHRERASYSPAPMPGRCDPWPVNRNAARPDARPRSRRPAAIALRPASELVAVGADDHRAVLQRRPRRWPATHADVGRREVRVGPGERREPRRPARRSALGACADTTHGDQPAVRAGVGVRRVALGRRLLEDDVRVGAADPERRTRRPGAAASPSGQAAPRSAARPRPPTSRRAATARRRAGSAAARRAASPAPS